MSEWYYLQLNNQVGPLPEETIRQLIKAKAITRDTLVWKDTLLEWIPASRTVEFIEMFGIEEIPTSMFVNENVHVEPYYHKSRIAAGLLNIFLPGVGRLYLGYVTIGLLQFVLTICTCGIFYLWSLLDGLLILFGTPSTDAKGKPMIA